MSGNRSSDWSSGRGDAKSRLGSGDGNEERRRDRRRQDWYVTRNLSKKMACLIFYLILPHIESLTNGRPNSPARWAFTSATFSCVA